MLYLSAIPFAELGFPADLPDEPPSVQTEKVMNTLPAVILGVGALLAGTAAYTHRKGPGHSPDGSSIASGREMPEDKED